MREYVLAPSILAANFCELEKDIKLTEEYGAKYLHFDVMDGMFVPSISFGAPVLQSIRRSTTQFIDAHLMVVEPIRYVEVFAKAGADMITIHLEACEDVQATIDKIKSCGIKCGISIKPKTPVEDLIPYLNQVDLVLIMSVEPGFGGQSFIPESIERIQAVRAMLDERNLDIEIQVDGGISAANVLEVLYAGANNFVAGSAIFGEETAEKTKAFVELIEHA